MKKFSFAITLLYGYTKAETIFCSYPQWSVPGVDKFECDREGCPMKIEDDCAEIYGVFEGDKCKVYCWNNPDLFEVYECAGLDEGPDSNDEWKLVSEKVDCE